MGDRDRFAVKSWPGWLAVAVVLVLALAACAAGAETAVPVVELPEVTAPPEPAVESPLPTSSPEAAPTPDDGYPVIYQRIELGEGGLSLEAPVSWQQLAPEWVWSPGGESQVRVGVRWVALAPPMEAEAVMLPENTQILDSQELDVAWGQARQFDIEVYQQPLGVGETRAPVASVERHVLVVVPGEVRRAYDLYAAAPAEEALVPALPVLDQMVASSQLAIATGEEGSPPPMPALNTPQATPNMPRPPETEAVQVFFSNTAFDPNAQDCGAVYPVERQVPAAAHRLDAALNELFAGPTEAERTEGYTSWFSLDTANILLDAFVEGDTVYVNLADVRHLIPNAGTSCGSAQLLAQMGQTAQAAVPGVTRVLYAIEGNPSLFYEWIQIGCGEMNDFCDPAPYGGN